MVWLAPLFLTGLALLLIPFWLHRLNDTKPERFHFASAMLLQASPEPQQVRRRLRFISLLILRLLLLLLLVLAFAQPVWQRIVNQLSTDAPRTLIILMDTSASMSARGQLDAALEQAQQLLAQADAQGQVIIATQDRGLKVLARGRPAASEIQTELAGLKAGETATDYGVMAAQVSRLMVDPQQLYDLHIISDFQRSGLPARFADLVPQPDSGAAYQLSLHPLAMPAAANWRIADAYVDDSGLVVNVAGEGNEAGTIGLRLRVNEQNWQRYELHVPADGRASLAVNELMLEPRQNRVEIELEQTDVLGSDNRYFLVADNTPGQPVLVLTDGSGSPAALYLQALFGQQAGSVFAAEVQDIQRVDWRILPRYDWVVVEDIGSLNSSQLAAVESYLRSGGALFAAMADNSANGASLPWIDGELSASAVLQQQPLDVAWIDYSHPALNDSEGWEQVRFSRWVPLQVPEKARVLVQLANGDPLLIEGSVGQGPWVLLTTSLDNKWNNLPIKPLFVSLMMQMGRYLADTDWVESQAFVGDALALKESQDLGQLINPNGQAMLGLGEGVGASRPLFEQSGFYQAYNASGEQWIAVNAVPAESSWQALSEQTLQRWQQAQLSADTPVARLSQRQAENSLELGYPLLLAAALVLLAESLLANRWLPRSTGLGRKNVVAKEVL